MEDAVKYYRRPLFESEQLHPCRYCGQPAGVRCAALTSGADAKEPHSVRCQDWYDAGIRTGAIVSLTNASPKGASL